MPSLISNLVQDLALCFNPMLMRHHYFIKINPKVNKGTKHGNLPKYK